MTLDDYQHAATRTINPALSERDRLLDAAAGLAEEAGELLGLVRKRVMQGRDFPRERVLQELGDALWCLSVAAATAGFSLDEVAKANIAKLGARHPNGFSVPNP